MYLDVFAIIRSLVIQLCKQALVIVLSSISELSKSVLVDMRDLLANRTFGELGIAATQRRVATSSHVEV